MPFLGALSVAVVCAAAPVNEPRAAFVLGQELFRAGRFAEAAAQFERANALKPHPAILFNLARCHEELGNSAQALQRYRRYLLEMPDAVDREVVLGSIVVLERALKARGVQQLMVVAEPSDSVIFVDGAALGKAPVFIELQPGVHQLRIEHRDLETLSRAFTMPTSKSFDVTAVLQPRLKPLALESPGYVTRSATSKTYPLRQYAWLSLTSTVVGVAAATAGFVVASNASRDLDVELASQGGVTLKAEDVARRGKTAQAIGWVGVGVAGAGAIASIIFLAATADSQVTPTFSVSPSGASFGLVGSLP